MKRALVTLLGLVALSGIAAPAQAWDPFERANPEVEEGNQAMREEDYAGALAAYERAARQLPSEPGVHLNRGLSLLAQGELDRAREAFLAAVEPPASDEIRADAYHDMGNAFYRGADQLAEQGDHQNAQRMFREAADAYRRSLRARPGNRDAAWNLELAMRRVREQEEEQRRQEEQEQQQQAQNDQQQQDQQQQDQQQQQQGDQQGDEEHADAQDRQDPSQDPQQQQDQGQGGQEQDQARAGGTEQLPDHVARVLDSLQESEENLERHRARARAQRERRQVEKDW